MFLLRYTLTQLVLCLASKYATIAQPSKYCLLTTHMLPWATAYRCDSAAPVQDQDECHDDDGDDDLGHKQGDRCQEALNVLREHHVLHNSKERHLAFRSKHRKAPSS